MAQRITAQESVLSAILKQSSTGPRIKNATENSTAAQSFVTAKKSCGAGSYEPWSVPPKPSSSPSRPSRDARLQVHATQQVRKPGAPIYPSMDVTFSADTQFNDSPRNQAPDMESSRYSQIIDLTRTLIGPTFLSRPRWASASSYFLKSMGL